jgi:4-hydroxy-3-polyprenylbenzoate decarboxylase
MSSVEKRLIIGISGATGMVYALRLLESVPADFKIHLVASDVAKQILKTEAAFDIDRLSYASTHAAQIPNPERIQLHGPQDHFAAIASGSYHTSGMVVIPCSMKTLAGIANGYAGTLIERAADVTLKEKRRLVLVTRETPLNRIHLQNMLQANDAGATILPASPGFYHKPQSIDDLVNFVVARTLEALDIPQELVPGWKEK